MIGLRLFFLKRFMQEKETLSKLADVITEKPVKFRVNYVYPTPLEKLLIRLRVKKPYREFEIKPIVLGKLVEISKLMLAFDPSTVNLAKGGLAREISRIAVEHGEQLAEIVALAVHPGKEVPQSLIEFLKNNLSHKALQEAATVVLNKLDVQSFLISIISLHGVQVLKTGMSPQKEEIIASTP